MPTALVEASDQRWKPLARIHSLTVRVAYLMVNWLYIGRANGKYDRFLAWKIGARHVVDMSIGVCLQDSIVSYLRSQDQWVCSSHTRQPGRYISEVVTPFVRVPRQLTLLPRPTGKPPTGGNCV